MTNQKAFSFKGKILKIDNLSVPFSHSIRQVLKIDNGFIVRLGSYTDLSQNIYFVNPDGTIKWRVQHISQKDPKDLSEKTKELGGYVGYTEIRIKDDELVAFSFLGVRCKVDWETGKVFDIVVTK